MLFIFIFHPCICANQTKYNNSENIANLQQETSLKACIFSSTEHFVLEKEDTQSRVTLSSSNILQTLISHLEFLFQLQSSILIQDEIWIANQTYADIFK